MLPQTPPELQTALDMGMTLFAGEAEGQLDGLLRDAATAALAPIYNYLNELPDLAGAPVPFLVRSHLMRTMGAMSAFDAGRGCPYQCSFCTIINVQGRKSRRRTADDVERIVRENWAQGISYFIITDDNLARNKDWEAIFDRLIKLREEEGLRVHLAIQVDTLCHKIPNFVDKAARAGVERAYIGVDSINPDTLVAAKKRQNKITEYRQLLLDWKNAGVFIYCHYIILGFANDTPESIRRDIAIIQKELPVDMMLFYCLTPLPGSEDHLTLWRRGVAMDADMNLYDSEHAVVDHPKMSRTEWEHIYREAWRIYYTPEHCRTVLRRAAAANLDLGPWPITFLFVAVRQLGTGPSAAGRRVPPEISHRSSPRLSDRAGLVVLPKICVYDRRQAHTVCDRRPQAVSDIPGHCQGSEPRRVSRQCLDAGRRKRDRKS